MFRGPPCWYLLSQSLMKGKHFASAAANAWPPCRHWRWLPAQKLPEPDFFFKKMAWLPQSSFKVRLFRSWWGCNVKRAPRNRASSRIQCVQRVFPEAPQVWCCLLDFRRPASAEVNSLRQITASLDLGRFQALYEHYHFIGIDHHLLSTFPFLDFVDNLGTAEIKP